MSRKILIIGGNALGATTAARLRRLSEDDEIVIIEKQKYISYSSCQLPYFIEGTVSEVDDLLAIEKDEFEKNRNIKVKYNSEVLAIDKKSKKVIYKDLDSNNEKEESYDYLVYALGSLPRKINISNDQKDTSKIKYLKTIDDAVAIKNWIIEKKVKNVFIVGAGFIGLEMAEVLINKNISVSVVDSNSQILNNSDLEMSKFIESIYDKKGVKFFLNSSINSYDSETVTVNDNKFDCDMIIVSVGVTPNTQIAKNSGLNLNESGELIVNEFLETSDKFIYSGGDAAITNNIISNEKRSSNLAWASNRQGRIIADNINGLKSSFKGVVNSNIIKVFDYTFAGFGLNEKKCKDLGIEFKSVHIRRSNYSDNFEGSYSMFMKLVFNPTNRKILGCQIFGKAGVDKRIDIISTVAKLGGTIDDLPDVEVAYSPHYSAPKDPVNILGYVAINVADKKYDVSHCHEVENNCNKEDNLVLDVRTETEFNNGHFNGAKNITYGELRHEEIDDSKNCFVNCGSGHRSYMAICTLKNKGYKGQLYNLSGGYALKKQLDHISVSKHSDSNYNNNNNNNNNGEIMKKENLKTVDLSGLQCPGPIVKANKETKNMSEGQQITFKTDDLSFEPDIKAWSEKNGFRFIESFIEKGELFITIEKSTKPDSINNNQGSRSRSIIVFSNDLDKVMASLIVANGAVASGEKVHLFFTFWGLSLLRKSNYKTKSKKTFLEKMFSFMLPKGTKKLKLSKMNMGGMGTHFMNKIMKRKNVSTCKELLDELISSDDVTLIACAMSMDMMGIKQNELIEGVEIAGVAKYISLSQEGTNSMLI
jgi:NADPH-dependent 2,4-dienoyl-CoA reductase/sulfur reductase-like enzyme/peroxiredoxin family protein/TusA-related sulfurtransferase/rhodanese-related sulfurtransferase